MTCPNCGSTLYYRIEAIPNNIAVQVLACRSCGCLYNGRDEPLMVPECSRPPEYKDIPDSDGPWWEWDRMKPGWRLRPEVFLNESGEPLLRNRAMNSYGPCHQGKWVRCEPPRIPPPSPRTPAERLRALVNEYHAGVSEWGQVRDAIVQIADELEAKLKEIQEIAFYGHLGD